MNQTNSRIGEPSRVSGRLDVSRRDMIRSLGAGLGSVKTLVDIQHDAAVAATVRRRAARDVLEMGLRYRDAADLEVRLAALEKKLADDPETQPLTTQPLTTQPLTTQPPTP